MSPLNLILAANTGSSSLKLALFSKDQFDPATLPPGQEPVSLLALCSISNVGSPNAKISYKLLQPRASKDKMNLPSSVFDHAAAFEYFLQILFSDQDFVQSGHRREHITHVCHRVVHGGDFTESVIVQRHTYDRLESLSDLAPLHNNRALAIIRSCHKSLPLAKSIAFFDSAFHRTLPPSVYTYPISPSVSREKNLRKYGFHGISYAFILRTVATYLNKPTSKTSLIVLHLGSGASACAIRNGESVNVSMGLTPVSGLPGATRSGDVDPSLIFHYTADASEVGRMSHGKVKNIHVTEAENILNTQSGWKALTGTSEFHEIVTSEEPSHRLAFEIFVDRIAGYVGAYYVQLEGQLDALVFSGGIGENSPELRSAVVQRCACLGFDPIAETRNRAVKEERQGIVIDVGEGSKRTRTLMCKTDEELEVARQCALKDEFWNTNDIPQL